MFLLIMLLLFSSTLFAGEISCPSVENIKKGVFHYWLPLYIEGEELASAQDIEQFQKHITEFRIARWETVYLENAHCFYKGNDPIFNKIVLAHDAWRPVADNHWLWILFDVSAECRSINAGDCRFII